MTRQLWVVLFVDLKRARSRDTKHEWISKMKKIIKNIDTLIFGMVIAFGVYTALLINTTNARRTR